jgi:DHA1 family tetracycline resistance protein-like MFS transporter
MGTAVAALMEFLINPTLGSLSDAYGRRPFMMMAPWASLVLKSWVLISPSVFSLTTEKIVCDGLRTMAGTTMTGAALSDLVEGPQLAVYTAKLFSAMGLTILAGPAVASFFTARQTYVIAIIAALAQLGIETKYLKETLPESKRIAFKGFVNPLGMLKLFTANKELTLLTITVMLQNLVDLKIMADSGVIFQLETLGWARSFVQRYTSVIG